MRFISVRFSKMFISKVKCDIAWLLCTFYQEQYKSTRYFRCVHFKSSSWAQTNIATDFLILRLKPTKLWQSVITRMAIILSQFQFTIDFFYLSIQISLSNRNFVWIFFETEIMPWNDVCSHFPTKRGRSNWNLIFQKKISFCVCFSKYRNSSPHFGFSYNNFQLFESILTLVTAWA